MGGGAVRNEANGLGEKKGSKVTQRNYSRQRGPPLVASISVLHSRLGRGNHSLLSMETPSGLKQFFR